jgi:REP element-mobilizing transposase RayT
MPRQARLDICGLVYHAMARGIERREIFQDEKDWDGLIDRLGGLVVQAGARLYAWSLLPDHFHLILRRGERPQELKKLEAIFQHKVFNILFVKGKITKEMIAMLSTWRHSGFHVFCGNRISPDEETSMENLARYIIRASFSQERMQYLDQEATVIYTAKNGKDTTVFPALEWLANLCSHIPPGRADGALLKIM